jgi:hypothetical protein
MLPTLFVLSLVAVAMYAYPQQARPSPVRISRQR